MGAGVPFWEGEEAAQLGSEEARATYFDHPLTTMGRIEPHQRGTPGYVPLIPCPRFIQSYLHLMPTYHAELPVVKMGVQVAGCGVSDSKLPAGSK